MCRCCINEGFVRAGIESYFNGVCNRRIFPLIEDKASGYRPGYSTLTGAIRVAKHVVALVNDIIFVTVLSLPAIIQNLAKRSITPWNVVKHVVTHILMATITNVINIARGVIEMMPGIGNGLCYTFDRLFEPLSDWFVQNQHRFLVYVSAPHQIGRPHPPR